MASTSSAGRRYRVATCQDEEQLLNGEPNHLSVDAQLFRLDIISFVVLPDHRLFVIK